MHYIHPWAGADTGFQWPLPPPRSALPLIIASVELFSLLYSLVNFDMNSSHSKIVNSNALTTSQNLLKLYLCICICYVHINHMYCIHIHLYAYTDPLPHSTRPPPVPSVRHTQAAFLTLLTECLGHRPSGRHVKWLCCPFNSILQEELTQGIWHKKLQFAYFPLLEVLAGYMRIIHRHTKGSLDLWYLYYWPLSILYMSASVLHFERVLSMLHLPYCW